MPDDSYMLLSFINTKLRDEYASLGAFCADYGCPRELIEEKLAAIGYFYDEARNAFR